MISNQILQTNIEGLKGITRVDLCICDTEGKVLASTFTGAEEYESAILAFVDSPADSQVIQGYQFFKVFDDHQLEYILLAKGGSDDVYMVGKMAAFQVQNLLVAYKERFDKDNFIKNLLLDNLLLVDIYNRAKKLHIETNVKRIVFIIETQHEKDVNALETVRSLFSTKTGNIMMQDAAQQMPYLYGTNELSVWLDDEYYNYDNFAAMREKCEGLNAELQANGAEIEVLYDGVGGYANRWIYTEDGQIYYDLLGTYEFSGTPLVQVSDASALFGVRPATWDNEYRCDTVANGAPYAVARSDGSLLSSFRYKNVCMAGDELIAVEDTDGNWGYCDINGEEVIPCTYQAAMQAEGASEPIDYPFPDMSGVVVVQDADGARMALYTDGTVCIEAGRFEDLAPAQGGCVWARQNGQWGLLEVK